MVQNMEARLYTLHDITGKIANLLMHIDSTTSIR